jgi:hypothetical protein
MTFLPQMTQRFISQSTLRFLKDTKTNKATLTAEKTEAHTEKAENKSFPGLKSFILSERCLATPILTSLIFNSISSAELRFSADNQSSSTNV